MRQECHPGCDKISSRIGKLVFKGMKMVLLGDYKREALVGRKIGSYPFSNFRKSFE
jgi:hypothetical protein